MLHLARLARLDDEADLRARPLADQVVVHGGGREQARDGRVARVGAAVGQDEDRVPSATASDARLQSSSSACSRPSPPEPGGKSDRQRDGVQPRLVDLADLRQLLVREARRLQLELARVERRLLEEVLLRPDRRRGAT